MPADKITKLCLASAHFLPAHGGATIRFLGYCPGFLERGINVQILTGTPKAKDVMPLGIKAHENTLTDDKIPLSQLWGKYRFVVSVFLTGRDGHDPFVSARQC